MDDYFISGIQQLGIGVSGEKEAWAWYRKVFGMDIPIFQDAGPAPYMTRYTGGTVHERTATLALNLAGGSGFEIWQFTSRKPEGPAHPPEYGDYGIFAGILKTPGIETAHSQLEAEGAAVTDISSSPNGAPVFYLQDPSGNWFTVMESSDWFTRPRRAGNGLVGAPCGAVIGVSDIDRALSLYRDVLGYDEMIYDASGAFGDITGLPGGRENSRRVLLTHGKPRMGAFSGILGKSYIELVQAESQPKRKIYEGRYWGDLGFIQICFDISGMQALRSRCEEAGFPFTVDSEDSFDMGEASGHFTYIEDPDGTLIEFVETHKMPISKKRGLYLNLKKRKQEKPLPKWMLKTLRWSRVKD